MKLIFFGSGYCSKYIIPKLEKKFEIICTHKSYVQKQNFDKDLNVTRLTLNEFEEKKDHLLKDVTHIINSIPPIKSCDLVYNLIKKIPIGSLKTLKWFGYFSSTSVYGDHSGNWVNEETQIKPATTRGRNRSNIEELFIKTYMKNGFPTHIFRLPGIYGPRRSAIDKLRNGNKYIIKKKNHFFSRVHVEDIASAVILSMKKITPGEIFNITDNYPCSAEEVTQYAAKLLKIENLDYVDINSSKINDRVRDFYSDNKKVANEKIKKILGWTPKFENYKLGLENILKKTS